MFGANFRATDGYNPCRWPSPCAVQRQESVRDREFPAGRRGAV